LEASRTDLFALDRLSAEFINVAVNLCRTGDTTANFPEESIPVISYEIPLPALTVSGELLTF
jgi:hypothetical protein